MSDNKLTFENNRVGKRLVVEIAGEPWDAEVIQAGRWADDGSIIGVLLDLDDGPIECDFMPSGRVIFETGISGQLWLNDM